MYVRIGIRLLYKGLKSREMEKKRSKSEAWGSRRTVLTNDSSKDAQVDEFQTREKVR